MGAGALAMMGMQLVGASAAWADSTYNVPCAGPDGGPLGLVTAINKANASQDKTTIKLVSGCAYVYTEPHGGPQNALPPVTSPIVITSNNPGDRPAYIERSPDDGTPPFRVLEISHTGDLTLQAIVVAGGRAPDGDPGGAAPNSPATNGTDGGGILNAGRVVLAASGVVGNVAGNGGDGSFANPNGGNGGSGGGIYNTGVVDVKAGSTVSANVSGSGGAAAGGMSSTGGSGGNGGGIANVSGGLSYLEDHTTISDNTTGNGGGGGMFGGAGGNGGNGGGVSSVANGTLTQVYLLGANTKVDQNATGHGGDSMSAGGNGGDGGGLFNKGDQSEVLSSDASQIVGNTTGAQGAGGSTATGGNGGGISAPDEGTRVILKKGFITYNSAAGLGGGLHAPRVPNDGSVTVNGTVIQHNTPDQCSPGTPC